MEGRGATAARDDAPHMNNRQAADAVAATPVVAAAIIGKVLSGLFRLTPTVGRTLVFSLGTRNSFVMLPLALSLPEVWHAAVVVIVFQSLVELFGMVAFLKWVPGLLIPDATRA